MLERPSIWKRARQYWHLGSSDTTWHSMDSPSTQPTPAPLERLPLHLFEHICKYVTRRSLFSLSLTSTFCRQAATPQRLSRLGLTIRDKQKLRDDLQQWVAILGRGDGFRHVRRVVVVGFMLDGNESEVDPRRHLLPSTAGTDSDGDSDGEDERFWFPPDWPPLTTQFKQGQHEAWLPFAQFLGQLPGLKDLVYACTHQLPVCVLTALHQYHPHSRLHVHTFSLRSLYQERDQLHDIDPDELALATSPCLYSIRARCLRYDTYRRFSFNLEAVESMVRGYAPALRRVSIVYESPGGFLGLQEAIRAPRAPWRGFPGPSPDRPSPQLAQPALAHLETLVLSGNPPIPWGLAEWNNRTDFTRLRRFELFSGVSLDALNTLASMAADNKFHSLQVLGLYIAHERSSLRLLAEETPQRPSDMDKATSLFLQAIPPLHKVDLTGAVGPRAIHALLHRHGPALRTLRLLPRRETTTTPTNDLAHALPPHCPRLETLTLRVERRRGGPQEVAVYRALGALPRLARLTVLLDCHLPDGAVPADDEAALIRATLANCAVDGALARAVFEEVAAAGGAGPRLERLRIETKAAEVCGGGLLDYDELARWVARSWVCEGSLGGGGEVVVREDDEGSWFGDVESLEYHRGQLDRVKWECREVWEELWPGRGGDWRDEWTSFPLERA